ncbi:MAG TPA: VanW family protein [Polyangiaceae bacterium]|nr:VanW family protein [Polyangiaceae bacterium]
MRHGLLVAAFVLGGALAGGAVAAIPVLENLLGDRPSVLVGGYVPPERSELRGWLEQRAERLGECEAHLALDDGLERLTFAELGLDLDVDATLEAIESADLRPGLFSRLYRHYRPDPAPIDVKLAYRFDTEQAKSTLEHYRERMHRDPENARLDLDGKRNVPDVPGREIDVPSTLGAIASGARDEDSVFAVAAIPIQAAVTSDMLGGLDVSRVLGSYETDFARRGGPRVINIRRAARLLDGLVLGPGEEFSFNRAVGPRTQARGFVEAPEIVNDEMVPGLGGGVCQVASTLHAAAVYGGLEVVRRRSHSRPSGYAPLGLDATVIYGEVDLKLRNPFATPIIVHAYNPTKTTVRVELLGLDPPGKIEHAYAVRESEDFFRRVVFKDDMPAGEQKREQKGSKGYDIISTVTLTRPDGTTSVRHYSSRYWPVPEIYWVGRGTDPTTLPELPTGATHWEVGGEGAEGADRGDVDSERERQRESDS